MCLRFLICLFSVFAWAQDYSQGTVEYGVRFVGELSMDEPFDRYLKGVVPAIEDIRFKLKFKEGDTHFGPVRMLANDFNANDKKALIIAGKHEYFLNKDRQVLKKIELGGTLFMVLEEPIKWNITNETKRIGEFDCHKAVAESIIDNGKIVEKNEIVAWFTNSIPIAAGPKAYRGLPGLIMELTDRDLRFYVSNIKYEGVELPKEPNGKVISKKQLDDYIDRLAKERFGIKH